ncbi:hypothetical protein V1514DRAFT_325139 [Lipomyces japonicus]|uniref:uncharacterized protein n=1 Tax=Lipomyces japonicus TaxID=56871 RepID=UPI0034CF6C2B
MASIDLQQLGQVLSGQASIAELYRTTPSFTSALYVHSVLMIVVYLTGVVTQDYSQVDRLWSILPTVTIFSYAYHAHYCATQAVGARTIVLLIIQSAWSIRLTFNFARKGGYSGTEDYRWIVLRRDVFGSGGSIVGRACEQIFSIGFISVTQLLLLLFITKPAWLLISKFGQHEFAVVPDAIFAGLMASAILVESITDNKQWRKWKKGDSHRLHDLHQQFFFFFHYLLRVMLLQCLIMSFFFLVFRIPTSENAIPHQKWHNEHAATR